MRNALHEIALIERYLHQQLPAGERLLTEVRMITDKTFARAVEQQRTVYACVQAYGRKLQREQLESLFDQLMQEPQFKQTIEQIFY